MANRMVLCAAIVLYLLAAVVAWVTHGRLAAHALVNPHVSYGDPLMVVEPEEDHLPPPRRWSTYAHPDDQFDPCAWDCSGESCRQLVGGFKSTRMRRYLFVIACFIGISWLFVQQDDTLPKYLIRRFDEKVLYALFQTINPVLIVVMVGLIPLVPGLTDVRFTLLSPS